MLDNRHQLIAALISSLLSQRYSPVVVRNYCTYASGFLDYLGQRGIPVADVIDVQVEQYLRHAIVTFERERGRRPSARWHEVPRSGIHALLRLAHGQWPPAIKPICAADVARFAVCDEYEIWLREERGLARSSVAALMWEARNFLAWQIDCGSGGLAGLSIVAVDRYMDLRAAKLTRCSLKSVAERLRSLLRYLHITGRVTTDLSGHVIAPTLYAYEGVPSILERDQIAAVLETARADKTPAGLRDYAILQFLATYGLRSGEICNLRIEDIDWRTEAIHVRHHKTRASTSLPLMEPVGEALLAYLRSGRPVTDAREIFLRTRAPYRKLDKLYSVVRRLLRDAGVQPPGKCGPHIFRHARAVEMLRVAVPQKVIGDVLGHRSTGSTAPYLKLATEDLRAIALEVPGMEVLA
ncbi:MULTISPECIES: site-specific integrase [Rhizobium/Agrobacterium group]|uniref:Phage integrase family protein n=2 Tax=Rhizobium/Agrobacterium group TaxID=227290 RepID=B9K431_ALLAM|nr:MULTISPECIES: site-specific integrase [Rhizobium/Agrobacterium group]ACM39685.1 phage integrase family protein [Allorhizobium ampelinum S4]ASK49719.1 integrase [Agrobacterium vitis]MCF1437081.1 tyrosine-type recombinase/integrase [Allorhizobium ampelinum]MCF1496307.1 tyrosine-type recombinase/integrase [Allorhizobium ampelinum]MUO31735.1 tyrosine-type recombinase/integrase [Agrobacterium vitis]